MQRSLFPVQLANEEPANLGTADLKYIGHDNQGRRYALKTLDDHPLLPLTEWLCYQLCAAAALPTPPFDVVKRLDGTLAFGSRWLDEIVQFNPGKMSNIEFYNLIGEAKLSISAAYTLDAFLPNQDRHWGNFLFERVGTRVNALLFDWSKTFILDDRTPFQPWAWPINCLSDRCLKQFKEMGRFDLPAANRTLNRINSIPPSAIGQIVAAAPEEWRTNVDEQHIMQWWSDHAGQRCLDTAALLR
ncbi:HipA family kinase [Chitiniphilus eburneus]|uniref:HipA family kinase n=1 Tax=Chitiniphilus eburneus TaxID=2571148 RepID=UPI0035CFB816